MSVWWPLLIAAQPSAWAGVGAANELSNQARTAGENGASGSPVRVPGLGSSGGSVTVATGRSSIGVATDFDHPFDFVV
jgi:hypothetical protein